MTTCARSIAVEHDPRARPPFCRLGAINDAPAASCKRHRPGTGAQKIGGGPRSAVHKVWCGSIGDAGAEIAEIAEIAETPSELHPVSETAKSGHGFCRHERAG